MLQDARSLSRGRTTTLLGTPWEYWASGRGPRGMLVLGGAFSHGDDRSRLMALFAPTRRVVSPTYPHYESVNGIVDGLVRLLDLERLERVDVFGDGLGAGLAHVLVRRYPDRVDRVALSGFGLWSPARTLLQRTFGPLQSLLTDTGLRERLLKTFQKRAETGGPERARELFAIADRMLGRLSREGLLRRLSLVRELFCRPVAHRLNDAVLRPGRALLLLENDDPAFSRAEQDALARTWPGANVTRYVSGGHLIGVTRAQELERKLDWFFRFSARELTSRAG